MLRSRFLVSVVVQNPTKGTELMDTTAILAELEAQRDRLDAAIQALGRKRPRRPPGAGRRSLSAAARAKIGAARKKRGAERKKKGAAAQLTWSSSNISWRTTAASHTRPAH